MVRKLRPNINLRPCEISVNDSAVTEGEKCGKVAGCEELAEKLVARAVRRFNNWRAGLADRSEFSKRNQMTILSYHHFISTLALANIARSPSRFANGLQYAWN
jgi:hypothetical protein